MVRRPWLPILAFALLLSPSAQGQSGNKSAATALFKEGRDAFDKGDFPTACTKFAESQKADPAPGTLLNLAVCEDRLGKLLSAKQRLEELIPQLPKSDDRIPFAKELAVKLDERIPRLKLILARTAPPDTKVKLAGESAPLPLDTPIPMDPGKHDLVVTAPGRLGVQVQVQLEEKQRVEQAVAPGVSLAAETDKPPDVPKNDSSSAGLRRILGISAGGLGVAFFGVATATGVVLLGKKSDVDAHCPNMRCDAEGIRLKNEAESTPLLPLNTASWIIGISGVAAGTVLIVTSLGGDKTAAFGPTVLPTGGVGFGVRGSL
jgi:hypothetical protein